MVLPINIYICVYLLYTVYIFIYIWNINPSTNWWNQVCNWLTQRVPLRVAVVCCSFVGCFFLCCLLGRVEGPWLFDLTCHTFWSSEVAIGLGKGATFFFIAMVGTGKTQFKEHTLDTAPLTVTVTTRIITFLVGDPYKPSFATVTGRGDNPKDTQFSCASGNFSWILILHSHWKL